jgi:hypothetical protein
MNIPKEAIEKAIEGGWAHPQFFDWQFTALDPTFWQALGNSLEWTHVYCLRCHTAVPLWGECKCNEDEEVPEPQSAWRYNAHRFIDLVLQGQDTVEFWKELLDAS